MSATLTATEPLSIEAETAPDYDPVLPPPAYALHDIEIRDDDGTPVFTQQGVAAPASWSHRAVKVAASKYLYGDPARGNDPATGGRESSIFQLHERVAHFIAAAGFRQGVLATEQDRELFKQTLKALTLGQFAAFNSPVWFNAGIDRYGIRGNDLAWAYDDLLGVHPITDIYAVPQCSACFIQSVEDNMESLMQLARNEAILFKHGSGSGTDFSNIRSFREKLSAGGKPSGPLSFMKIYDRIAATVKSGGKTRRAAKMQTLSVRHPDILEFIRVKGREEKKALALIAAGWDPDFNGEAYDTVAFQNANFSVGVTRAFMNHLRDARASDQPPGDYPSWVTLAVTTGMPVEAHDPRLIWAAIAEETWRCGDPGVQFVDTMNDWHTCPYNLGGKPQPIHTSNPCSEYMFIDDSACNLASLNLMKFLTPEKTINLPQLQMAVRQMFTAMEILVDAASYPTAKIAQNSHDFRPLGLGFANLGGLLQTCGIAYDSTAGRQVAGCLASIICGEAYAESARLAQRQGAFPGFEVNREPMLRVIKNHLHEATRLQIAVVEDRANLGGGALQGQLIDLAAASVHAWHDALDLGAIHGFRNAQATVIAPTGTIAFMMDCETTGIEPNLALRAWKSLAGGGGMWVTNRIVPDALDALGYGPVAQEHILGYLEEHGTLEDCPWVLPWDLPVFDCSLAPPGRSRVLRPEAHLLMLAAVQPFVSGSISKTVNVPADFTVEQIAATYEHAEQLGLKCVAIYRDGSKGSQPLNVQGGTASTLECPRCGSKNVVPAGTCGVCKDCGESLGGCG
jgi:ribonucleoside-diphosphate reductase alpha chain